MKLKFKIQDYQTNAVEAVLDCFAGQPKAARQSYRVDPGRGQQMPLEAEGFKNAAFAPALPLLANIQAVQKRQNLNISPSLRDFRRHDGKPMPANYKPGADVNLDIEMETGTGKTYCYIKTMFEMHKRFGWSKFIVMVPSVAIREGVKKSFEVTAEHFLESYGKRARFFIYNSKRLHELESFSSDSGINVMIVNTQAFAAKGKDQRRIYMELDDFQSRRPIDVIAANRPILILDEPQKMGGDATLNALPSFKPLFILRYSATHRIIHTKVHRLDAVDAYNQKLVKKIAVRGIQTRGLAGTNAYLYLEGIEISRHAPVARIDMEVKLKSGQIKRQLKRLRFGDDLFVASNELDQYRGFTLNQIDALADTVEFTNGEVLKAGEATGDVTEGDIRRIQIRETIKAHFDKEKQLFGQGIKVLSLFFIDEVAKYRDYSRDDKKGEYARIFEEEYDFLRDEYLSELALDNEAYRKYLNGIDTASTHKGYFSIDKKKKLADPKIIARGERAGLSDDVDAYDLILKDKESLLSYHSDHDEAEDKAKRKVRFIFSHSALREGWDNPNVFVMCMLKHSDNTISRRQEVGRGLRLSVNQRGDRIDHPAIVHDVNVLNVVASESYKDFVGGLQSEIVETLSSRPRHATEAYFTGKVLEKDGEQIEVTSAMAVGIEFYLIQNGYVDRQKNIVSKYHEAKEAGELADLPEDLKPYADSVFSLINSVFSTAELPRVDDGRKPKTNPLNDNFKKQEFKELWARINHKAVYRVEFETPELIAKCVNALDSHLRVTPLQFTIEGGEQTGSISKDDLEAGSSFEKTETRTEFGQSVLSKVKYDLVGNLASNTQITRETAAGILGGIQETVFSQFKQNPEHFIAEASRIIKEQKAAMVIEKLSYDAISDHYETDIFTANQTGQDFSRATKKLNKHIYDYVIADSKVEKRFANNLDTADEVIVYAKLPRGFLIPTPVGDYNPDWAISFKQGRVKHIYFVAETKDTMSSMKLREIEKTKIKCARKFFGEITSKVAQDQIKYDVVDNFDTLMDLVH